MDSAQQRGDEATQTWLHALLDPESLDTADTPAGRADASRRGAALIVQGRLFDYQVTGEARWGLPALHSEDRSDDVDVALLLGLLNHIRGERDSAIERYRQLQSLPLVVEVVAAGAALLSLALAESDRPVEALQVLREARTAVAGDSDGHALATAFLDLHLGRRQAEWGDWGLALQTTEAALALTAGGAIADLIRHTAQANVRNYEMRTKRAVHEGRDLGPKPAALIIRLGLRASALDDVLDQRVRSTFQSALSSEWRFQNEDPADRRLWSAAFRAECLGDFGGMRTARTALGRYRALKAAQGADPDPEGFQLLLEGGASSDLARATHWFLGAGPVRGLRDLVRRVARRPWLAEHEHATLRLLAVSGELLDPSSADESIDRIGALLFEVEPRNRSFVFTSQALPALTGVLVAASPAGHRRAADIVMALAEPSRDQLTHEGLWAVIDSLRWNTVSNAQVDWARGYAERHLAASGSASGVAAALTVALTQWDPTWAEATVMRLAAGTPSLTHSAVVLDATSSLPQSVMATIAEVARRHLAEERRSAAGGVYSFGGINPVRVLMAVLRRDPALRGWDDLVAYLRDPNVDVRRKRHPLNVMATNVALFPEDIVDKLRDALKADLVGHDVHTGELTSHQLAGPRLRLQVALSDVTADEALACLLDLATDPAASQRVEGAWSSARMWSLVGRDAVTVARVLAGDQHHDVRAAAATSLVYLAESLAEVPSRAHDASAVADILDRSLKDAGTAVPKGVLEALEDSSTAPYLVDRLRSAVEELSRAAASALVRDAAVTVLRRWNDSPPSEGD